MKVPMPFRCRCSVSLQLGSRIRAPYSAGSDDTFLCQILDTFQRTCLRFDTCYKRRAYMSASEYLCFIFQRSEPVFPAAAFFMFSGADDLKEVLIPYFKICGYICISGFLIFVDYTQICRSTYNRITMKIFQSCLFLYRLSYTTAKR